MSTSYFKELLKVIFDKWVRQIKTNNKFLNIISTLYFKESLKVIDFWQKSMRQSNNRKE